MLVGFPEARVKERGQRCRPTALMLLGWEGAWGSARSGSWAPLQDLEACRHDGGGSLREVVVAAAVVTTAEAAVLQSQLGKQKHGVNSSRMGGAPTAALPAGLGYPSRCQRAPEALRAGPHAL